MTQQKFRELCETVLVPLVVAAIEPRLVDIHDMLDITASELTRLDDRLDDVRAKLCRDADD